MFSRPLSGNIDQSTHKGENYTSYWVMVNGEPYPPGNPPHCGSVIIFTYPLICFPIALVLSYRPSPEYTRAGSR